MKEIYNHILYLHNLQKQSGNRALDRVLGQSLSNQKWKGSGRKWRAFHAQIGQTNFVDEST